MAAAFEQPRLAPRDVAKFTALVAFAAIFVDAAIGHGLTWENDPYWTYWITKTFLIATIFGLGTAWLGVGAARGALITVAHTLVLTIYYWSLSPIGLPSSPDWLDLDHTWITGLPIHFGVIYLGYLLALWIWRRRPFAEEQNNDPEASSGMLALRALVTSVALVVVAGALSNWAITSNPGATWFITRLLITFSFVYGWWTIAGRDRIAGAVGGTVLAFVWASYGQFLGPSGLPHRPLRIFDTAPPSPTVHWLSYRDVWLVSLPIWIAVMVLGMLIASRTRDEAQRPMTGAAVIPAVVVAAALGAFSYVNALEAPARSAAVNASGNAMIEQGPMGSTQIPGTAEINVNATDVGARVSPLPPHDTVGLTAKLSFAGHRYEIASNQARITDPLGRFTTWWGVGFDVWHHGRSGIGSPKLPAIRSRLALFAAGRVSVDGKVVATSAPIHFMTVDGQIPGVGASLDVGDDATPVNGLPGGQLHATWASYTGDLGQSKDEYSYGLGGFVLVVFIGAFLAAERPAPVSPPAPAPSERPDEPQPSEEPPARKPRGKPKAKPKAKPKPTKGTSARKR